MNVYDVRAVFDYHENQTTEFVNVALQSDNALGCDMFFYV